MIKTLTNFSRVFAFTGTLFLVFNCFGRRAKVETPRDIHTVVANRLSIEQWYENNRKDTDDLKKIMKDEIPNYLFTNLKIYEILTENMEIMEDALDDVDRLKQNMNSVVGRCPPLGHAQLSSPGLFLFSSLYA